MIDASSYRCLEKLRDGTPVEIRALRPDDEVGMLAALEQSSAQSRRRRFFVPKQHFSDKERDFFLAVDFEHHVALVACIDDAGIVGGGRYVVAEPGRAELAFMVIDAWQGLGIGGLLMRHLIVLAREAGQKQLFAEVLPENAAMRRVFDKFGFRVGEKQEPQSMTLVLALT